MKNEAILTLTVPDKLHELLRKYSSSNVLQRKIAWLLKFKVYLQHHNHKGTVSDTSHKYLMTANLEKANIAIVKLVQREVHAVEIKDLENQGNVKRLSKIAKLRPVLIDGVMRVGGRISEAPVAFGPKFPMIVPPNHHVTQLLIVAFHQKLAHAGQNHILAQLMQQFWTERKISSTQSSAIMSYMQEAEGSQHGANDGYLTSISDHSL